MVYASENKRELRVMPGAFLSPETTVWVRIPPNPLEV